MAVPGEKRTLPDGTIEVLTEYGRQLALTTRERPPLSDENLERAKRTVARGYAADRHTDWNDEFEFRVGPVSYDPEEEVYVYGFGWYKQAWVPEG